MRQFLYLDTDIVNSIVAQTQNGLINSIKTENEESEKDAIVDSFAIGVNGGINTGFKGLLGSEISADAKSNSHNQSEYQTMKKSIYDFVLHDAAFDIAYKSLKPVDIGFEGIGLGSCVEIKRLFEFVDINYLKRIFSSKALSEIEGNSIATNIKENTNRAQRRPAEGKRILADIKEKKSRESENITLVLDLLESIVPYGKMFVSQDGLLVPVENSFFRINPDGVGFLYGNEFVIVGMITNVIGKDTNLDVGNIFSELHFQINEIIRSILPTKEDNLFVITPIAIYYDII